MLSVAARNRHCADVRGLTGSDTQLAAGEGPKPGHRMHGTRAGLTTAHRTVRVTSDPKDDA
jgi:hypothetical protein